MGLVSDVVAAGGGQDGEHVDRTEEQRVAVGRRARDRSRSNRTACTRAIDHDELLAQPARQPGHKRACQHVGGRARLRGIDHGDGAARIILLRLRWKRGRGGHRGREYEEPHAFHLSLDFLC